MNASAAGVGLTAHCKHASAVIFSVNDFMANGKLNLKLTCTQKLQTFHRAKPEHGDAAKVIPRMCTEMPFWTYGANMYITIVRMPG